jgi:hypothetical protein
MIGFPVLQDVDLATSRCDFEAEAFQLGVPNEATLLGGSSEST